jgi:hypothetical protein
MRSWKNEIRHVLQFTKLTLLEYSRLNFDYISYLHVLLLKRTWRGNVDNDCHLVEDCRR